MTTQTTKERRTRITIYSEAPLGKSGKQTLSGASLVQDKARYKSRVEADIQAHHKLSLGKAYKGPMQAPTTLLTPALEEAQYFQALFSANSAQSFYSL